MIDHWEDKERDRPTPCQRHRVMRRERRLRRPGSGHGRCEAHGAGLRNGGCHHPVSYSSGEGSYAGPARHHLAEHPGYNAEARIVAAVAELPNAIMVPHLDRQICRDSQQRPSCHQGMFADDGVHLPAAATAVSLYASQPAFRDCSRDTK